MKIGQSTNIRNERFCVKSYADMMREEERRYADIMKAEDEKPLQNDEPKPQRTSIRTNLQKVDPPIKLNFSNFVPDATFNHLKILVIIILLCALLFLAYWLIMVSSNSCIKDYQRLECWRQESSKTDQCTSLELCMADE